MNNEKITALPQETVIAMWQSPDVSRLPTRPSDLYDISEPEAPDTLEDPLADSHLYKVSLLLYNTQSSLQLTKRLTRAGTREEPNPFTDLRQTLTDPRRSHFITEPFSSAMLYDDASIVEACNTPLSEIPSLSLKVPLEQKNMQDLRVGDLLGAVVAVELDRPAIESEENALLRNSYIEHLRDESLKLTATLLPKMVPKKPIHIIPYDTAEYQALGTTNTSGALYLHEIDGVHYLGVNIDDLNFSAPEGTPSVFLEHLNNLAHEYAHIKEIELVGEDRARGYTVNSKIIKTPVDHPSLTQVATAVSSASNLLAPEHEIRDSLAKTVSEGFAVFTEIEFMKRYVEMAHQDTEPGIIEYFQQRLAIYHQSLTDEARNEALAVPTTRLFNLPYIDGLHIFEECNTITEAITRYSQVDHEKCRKIPILSERYEEIQRNPKSIPLVIS